MKKGLSLILCLVLVVSSFAVAFADNSPQNEFDPEKPDYYYYATVLKELGVFHGTDNGFELERAATRAEALVMFLRILGVDRQAEEENIQPSFDDVPSWAKAYVGYAEANGLASGVGNGKFGSNNTVSAKDYATFLLRGLGYSDAAGDFSWTDSIDFLGANSEISNEYIKYIKTADFIRGDMALMSHEALVSNTKGGMPLVEKLGLGQTMKIRYNCVKARSGPYPVALQFDFLEGNVDLNSLSNSVYDCAGFDIGGKFLGASVIDELYDLYTDRLYRNNGEEKTENSISYREQTEEGWSFNKIENRLYSDSRMQNPHYAFIIFEFTNDERFPEPKDMKVNCAFIMRVPKIELNMSYTQTVIFFNPALLLDENNMLVNSKFFN